MAEHSDSSTHGCMHWWKLAVQQPMCTHDALKIAQVWAVSDVIALERVIPQPIFYGYETCCMCVGWMVLQSTTNIMKVKFISGERDGNQEQIVNGRCVW